MGKINKFILFILISTLTLIGINQIINAQTTDTCKSTNQ